MEKYDKKDDWKIKEEMTKHWGKCTRENRTKNHNDFKNTKQAGGEGLFSISELTHEGWAGQGAGGDAPAWLSAPAGHGHRGELPIFSLSFISHALQFKGT